MQWLILLIVVGSWLLPVIKKAMKEFDEASKRELPGARPRVSGSPQSPRPVAFPVQQSSRRVAEGMGTEGTGTGGMGFEGMGTEGMGTEGIGTEGASLDENVTAEVSRFNRESEQIGQTGIVEGRFNEQEVEALQSGSVGPPALDWHGLLSDPETVGQAIVVAEVLGRPKALRRGRQVRHT